MTSRTAAARYAKALLDVVSKEAPDGGIERAGQELDAFTSLVRQNPSLHRVLTNPAVPAPRKRAAVFELSDEIIKRFLRFLIGGKVPLPTSEYPDFGTPPSP